MTNTITVELELDGVWTDVSAYVRYNDRIKISHGARNEGKTALETSECELTFTNTDGRFSPRLPTSPYYGTLGRNTPIRVTVGTDVRFVGEVAEWPPKRDISGEDATVSIKAAGISRRLKQGEAPLRSTMFREFSNPERANIVAYWPLEDDAEATQAAAASSGVRPARVTGAPTFASFSDWTASGAIPEMKTGSIIGTVPSYVSTGEISVRMFVFYPAGGVSAETSLLLVRTTGTAETWEITLTTGGGLRTKAWDNTGAAIDDGAFVDFDTGALDAEFTDALGGRGFVILDFELSESGTSLNWRTLVIDFANTDTINDSIPTTWFAGTLANKSVGSARTVAVGRGLGLGDTVVGHLAVANDLDAYASTGAAIAAHNGEEPSDRMTRLCEEEDITFTVVGSTTGNTVTLGDQVDKSLLDLLQEAADADGGILYEPRDALGLAYRTRLSMQNQDAALTLSCATHDLNDVLAPLDDDQRTENDITVKREAGSSVRVEQTTGRLSTAAPPDGVGRYDTSTTLSLEDDAQLGDQAGWRLHLGTVDEARYPKIQVHLNSNEFDDTLRSAALTVDVGDRIVITDPSGDLPPDDISQIVIGYSETIDQFEHVIAYVCTPESPWHVGQVETSGFDRIDTAGSALAADATSTATTLSVSTTTGPLWTTAAGDMPFDILVGGERCTVTAISGTSSPQTFTVTRSVNGVVKAQSSGSGVGLAEPVAVAM